MITSYTGTAEVVEFPETINGNTIGMLANKSCVETYTYATINDLIKAING